MKKRILICTIMRNQGANIDTWRRQLEELILFCPEYEFTISVYENDSTDGTKAALDVIVKNAPFFAFGDRFHVVCENIGTKQYGSIWNVDRLRNLATARQKCIDQVGHLNFDKIAFIEPDVEYDPKWCKELILARHPAQAQLTPHIYSGWSLRSSKHPKESHFLYDTTATRQTHKDVCWNFENESSWRGKSLIPTAFSDIDSNCLHFVWSTFNCFCVYDVEPFKKGLEWDYQNYRLNTGQELIKDGDIDTWLDADTSIMCEDFRAMGFNNIFLNTNCLVRHR